MINRGMFTSSRDDWETPQYLFDALNAEFRFEIDVCAVASNAKCKKYFSPDLDGLSQKWTGVCWCNPPYGSTISCWVEKAFYEAQKGATVVLILPVRSDTKWWQKYVMRGEIRFFAGRLKFGSSKNSAPFPSAVVIFRPPRCI